MSTTKSGAINDSTIARIAGNLLSGVYNASDRQIAMAVDAARQIAAEVERPSTRTVQS